MKGNRTPVTVKARPRVGVMPDQLATKANPSTEATVKRAKRKLQRVSPKMARNRLASIRKMKAATTAASRMAAPVASSRRPLSMAR